MSQLAKDIHDAPKPRNVWYWLHLRHTNDVNGNPRRLWVALDVRGRHCLVHFEGYGGRPTHLYQAGDRDMGAYDVTPAEYKRQLTLARQRGIMSRC